MKRLLATLAALLLLAPAADAAFPGRNGALVYGWSYTSSGHVERGIWMTPPHGPRRLVVGCSHDGSDPPEACTQIGYTDPTVAPDGARIVFDAGRTLAVADIDGGNLQMLPQVGTGDGQPAFAPDGRRVVFVVDPPNRRSWSTIWIMDLEDGTARRLARGIQPAWSTRNWIAFLGAGDQIYRVRPNGSGLRRITSDNGAEPAWSPRGDRLAYARPQEYGNTRDLFVMDAHGGHVRQVSPVEGGQSAWSPDGLRVAVLGNGFGTYTLSGHRVRSLGARFGADPPDGQSEIAGVDWQSLPR